MPRYLLKPDRGEDYYVEWSTIVDAPIWQGPAAEALKRCPPELVERASETGTSDPDPYFYGYDCDGMILGGRYWLPRRNLAAVTRLLHEERVADDDPRLQALLEDPADRPDVIRLVLSADEDER
ncbi:hypothetical protein ACQPZ8_01510 [Actinomadura nitritigenes]|uniref:hypothetical protein n=1 Tax=Actinomadura nitritigenes TaxID=134602 RepID=UPI003D8FA917